MPTTDTTAQSLADKMLRRHEGRFREYFFEGLHHV